MNGLGDIVVGPGDQVENGADRLGALIEAQLYPELNKKSTTEGLTFLILIDKSTNFSCN